MDLLVGTIALRPYVFVFLAIFLLGGRLGPRLAPHARSSRAGVWPVAWVAEFSSTRTGIPFGLYHYTGHARAGAVHRRRARSWTRCRSRSSPTRRSAWRAFVWARRPPSATADRAARRRAHDAARRRHRSARGARRPLVPRAGSSTIPTAARTSACPLSNFLGWVIVGMAGVGVRRLRSSSRAKPTARRASGRESRYTTPCSDSTSP